MSRKSIQWEANYSMQMERQTGMMKLTVSFFNSANVPKIAG
jgi:hypothetical protein